MDTKIIEVEADSLEEAREKIKSQIPTGLHLLSEEIISDGEPVIKTKQTIQTEAETLEEAREQLKSQTPEGFQLLSEKIISDGKPKTVKGVANTADAAFAKAQIGIPNNADILEKKELVPSERKMITVEAFDEWTAISNAEAEASKQFGSAAVVQSKKLAMTGKKGFLGIGKKPDQYEAEILVRQATVEVSYKLKAKISADVGEVYKPKAKISAKVGLLDIRLHEVVTAMCADPGRSFNKGAHAAPLYKLLPISKIPKDVADLFVDATTLTAKFTEVDTYESIDALKKLCTIEGAVVDNLLHCIAKMSDTEHILSVFDFTGRGGSSTRTTKVSFASQRKIAHEELTRRGSPEYDTRHYVGR
jgi:hypothetical protein